MPCGTNRRKKLQAVLVEAVDQHGEEHHQRQRRGDDDVARHREGVGDEPDEFATRTNMKSVNTQREELHALLAGGAVDRVGDELVGQLRDRLHAGRAPAPAASCAPTSSAAMPTTMIAMYSAELVNAISCPPMWPSGTMLVDFELMNRIGHRRKLPYRPVLSSWSRSAGNTGGAHHVDDAGGKAEQEKHDHPPRRDSEPLVERPADERTDQDTGDQFGGEAEAAGERRRIALRTGPVSACRPGPFCWASRSPRLWSLAERAASSADRLPFLLSSPVSLAMSGGPQFDTGVASKPR